MKVLILMLMALPLFAQVTPKTQVCNSTGSVCGAVTSTGVTVQGAGTAGTAAGGVVTIQGSASGTAVPVSVSSVPANQSVNVAQFGGSNVQTGTGTSGAGIPRVTVSSDSSTAVTQGTAANLNATVVGTGTFPVQVTTLLAADPCVGTLKVLASISQTGNARIIAGTSAKKIYVCAINIGPNADAENIALVEGTGSTCATGTIAVPGTPAATAAAGWQMAANGGLTWGSGAGTIAATSVNADDVCLLQSGTGRVAGGISYVVQ